MKATDFEYDGLLLSSYGFMICTFDGGGEQTVTNGSEINWSLVSSQYGSNFYLTNSKYDNYLTTSFQICKDPCLTDNDEITVYELRNLMRWLNRKQFHKFKLLEDEYQDFYYEGSFNVSRIEWYGKLMGLELTFTTNRPFALADEVQLSFENGKNSNGTDIYPWTATVRSISDDEGYIYADMEVTLKRSGDLRITNAMDGATTIVRNCIVGEKIHLSYPIIETSLDSHMIQDDFNWEFPKINNTYNDRENVFTFSIPCSVTIKYSPIIKVGV